MFRLIGKFFYNIHFIFTIAYLVAFMYLMIASDRNTLSVFIDYVFPIWVLTLITSSAYEKYVLRKVLNDNDLLDSAEKQL